MIIDKMISSHKSTEINHLTPVLNLELNFNKCKQKAKILNNSRNDIATRQMNMNMKMKFHHSRPSLNLPCIQNRNPKFQALLNFTNAIKNQSQMMLTKKNNPLFLF